jgi:hypothetical protein
LHDPLFRQVLGAAFDRLPELTRQVHSGVQHLSLQGVCSIERGHNYLARVAGAIAGMPATVSESPLAVRIDAHTWGEQWTRWFGRQCMQSTLTAQRGLLVERLGLLTIAFQLREEGGRLTWTPRAGRVLGVPMPARFFAGINAVERVAEGRYCFDVRAALPVLGLIVHYRGCLQVDA